MGTYRQSRAAVLLDARRSLSSKTRFPALVMWLCSTCSISSESKLKRKPLKVKSSNESVRIHGSKKRSCCMAAKCFVALFPPSSPSIFSPLESFFLNSTTAHIILLWPLLLHFLSPFHRFSLLSVLISLYIISIVSPWQWIAALIIISSGWRIMLLIRPPPSALRSSLIFPCGEGKQSHTLVISN